jgi:tetratricopeptide (TPR) repeat protein
LASGKALTAIGNYWKLRISNRGRRISFKLITTAAAGSERAGFGTRRGVDVWNVCGRSPVDSAAADIELIRDFLVKQDSLDISLKEFLEQSPPERIHQDLILPIEWLYDQPEVDDLQDILVGRLHKIGEPHGLTIHDAQHLANDYYMRVVDEAIRRQPRPLGFVEFRAMLERAAHVEIPRRYLLQQQLYSPTAINELITGGATAEQLPAVTDAGDAFPAPVLRTAAWRRAAFHDRIRAGLATGLVFVDGGIGMGKTTAVRQVVEGANPLLWCELRGKSLGEIVETIPNIIQRVGADGGRPVVVLDDFNPEGDPRILEGVLGKLSVVVRARAGGLAVISYKPAGPRLASVLGLSAPAQVTALPLEEDEIAQWMLAEGCPEGLASALARIVWVHTGGHPQLVSARVAGLKAAAFPKPSPQDVLDQPREIGDARAEALAVIRSILPEPARRLLYRLSLAIPPLKRSHSLRVAEAEPPVPAAGEMLELLIGPWLEQPLSDRYRVSALASESGRSLLPPDEARRIHGQIATALLSERTILAGEFSGAIAHALLGAAEAQLAVAIRVFLLSPSNLKRRLAMELRWAANAGLPPAAPLLLTNPAVRRLFRLFQWEVAGLAAPKHLAALSAAMEPEFAGLSAQEPAEALLRILYLSKQLLEVNHPMPSDRIVDYTLEIWGLADHAKNQGIDIGRPLRPLYPGVSRPAFNDLFAAALIPRVSSAADLSTLISKLGSLPSPERERLLVGFGTDDGELRLLFASPGILISRRGEGVDDYRRVLEQALEAGRQWQHHPWMRAGGRALAALLDELLHRPDEARQVVITTIQEAGVSSGLEDQLATIAFNRKQYAAALEIWQRVLPGWDADTALHDLQPAFSTRCAAISAAHLGKWDIAARLFREATDRSAGTGGQPWRVGLLGDLGYALWESGDRQAAATALSDAVAALSGMPNRPDSFAEYAVQKLVGHTLAWLADPDGHARPIPGMCSQLTPNEAIKQLPPAPASHLWFLLYDVARRAGDDGLAAKALAQFRDAPFAALRAIGARDELARMLRAGTLESVFRLATVSAIEMAKAAERNDVPTQQPDPPGLTGRVTGGLIARYIRPALWTGIMRARTSARNIVDVLSGWRREAEGVEQSMLDELVEAERQAGMETGELTGILRNPAAAGERRVLAAALLIGRDDTSPHDALYAQAMLIDASTDSDLLRDAGGDAFAALTRADWLRFCDNPAMLRSPRLYADTIRRACESGSGAWPAAARIILAATPATSLTIPTSIRSKLHDLAGGAEPSA